MISPHEIDLLVENLLEIYQDPVEEVRARIDAWVNGDESAMQRYGIAMSMSDPESLLRLYIDMATFPNPENAAEIINEWAEAVLNQRAGHDR